MADDPDGYSFGDKVSIGCLALIVVPVITGVVFLFVYSFGC